MKRKTILPPIVFIIALLAAWPAAAQSNGTAVATLSAPDGSLTVGDPIALILSITHPADQHVIAPELEASWGDFIIQDIAAPQTVSNADGMLTTSMVIDARLFAPGSFSTLPLTIKMSDAAGQVFETVAQPITIEISSVLIEGDSELRDIKPQIDTPYVNLIPWVVAAALLVGAAVVIMLLVRRQQARRALAAVDNRLAHEIALDELARIEGLRLPDAARFKEHYSLVSDCLRLYMERRLAVPMLERTTAEITAELRQVGLPAAIAGQYVSLLDASDLVKFSKYTPDAGTAYGVLQSARQVVLATRPVERVEPGTDDFSGQTMTTHQVNNAEFSKNGSYSRMEVGA